MITQPSLSLLLFFFFLAAPTSGFSKNKSFHFVHVGKTGGESLRYALKSAGLHFTHTHLQLPSFSHYSRKPIIISTRHPLNRTRSIWNWRKHLCFRKKEQCPSEAEQNLFETCTIDDVLQALQNLTHTERAKTRGESRKGKWIKANSSPCDPRLMRHFKQNHRWYCSKFTPTTIKDRVWAIDNKDLARDLRWFFELNSMAEEGKPAWKRLKQFHVHSDYKSEILFWNPKQEALLREALKKEISFYYYLREVTVHRKMLMISEQMKDAKREKIKPLPKLL